MQTVTEIVIDFSGSMRERLALTKEILLYDVIPNLDFASRIGIKTFYGNPKDNNALVVGEVLPLSICRSEDLVQAISQLGVPDGNSPIAEAISNSVASLKEFRTFDKKIILITDGEDNCGGDYELEARKAGEAGFFCEIHIIGIGLTTGEMEKAQRISDLTNGSFSNVDFYKGLTYSQAGIKESLTKFKQAMNVVSKANIPPQYTAKAIPSIHPPLGPQATNSNSSTTPDAQIIVSVDDDEEEKLYIQQVPDEEETIVEMDKNSIKEQLLENENVLRKVVEELASIKSDIKEIKSSKIRLENEDTTVQGDEELNEEIRSKSEAYLFGYLKKKYADRVVWLNEEEESYSDHDFEIVDIDSDTVEYFIECKGTLKDKRTFYLTKGEWRRFLNHTKNYQVYLIHNVFDNPSHIFIDNLLDWLLKGKVVPYLLNNEKVKAERITLTVVD
ncbi:protein NO VEIN domain-containing protein [Pontibacter chinhatensis]|uniref:von Willebrand factor type A domain-containing protein n=1 Tax=Pontibacter chinhatensis TaxID=1436961 RepID=A0A1I2ZLY6_9BACT|nr:DUF3883 domain-containing protein [Pontibacter chinhatensis]SFH38838.1 von Willebrand factor type A domain-containing protein [Pontibacter chinhatensis]